MRVESPDRSLRAELTHSEDSAGCHGVGGYHTTTTIVRVFDGSGRQVFTVQRSRTEETRENDPEDTITGTTIESVRFSGDGRSIVLSLASGEEETCALPSSW